MIPSKNIKSDWLKSQLLFSLTSVKRISLCLFYTFLGLFQPNFIVAQSSEADSLQALLADAPSDSERLILMNKLTKELIDSDLGKAIDNGQKAIDYSQQIGNKEQEVYALRNMGLVIYETSSRPSAITYFEESEKKSEELGLREMQSRNLMTIAKYHRYVSKDSIKTVENLLKSAEISKSVNFNWGTGRSYAKLASFYSKYNQLDLCEQYLQKASEYYLQMDDGKLAMAHYYNEVGEKIWDTNPKNSMDFFLKGVQYANIPNLKASLGKAYSFIGDHQTALKYIKEAISFYRQKKNAKRMLGIAIAQLSEVHIQLGNYDAANNACDEGIELLSPLGRTDQRALPALYRAKGIIATKAGDEKTALEYYTKSHDEAIRIKYAFARIKSTVAIGDFYSLNNPEKGRPYCEKSLKSAKKRKYASLEIASCNCLYNIHKERGSFKSALRFHEQKQKLIDSLSNMNLKHSLDINGKIAEKDKELAEQVYQKEINDKELMFQNTFIKFLLITTFLGILLIGFLTLSYRRISGQNKEINEKTSELENLNQSLELSNQELERFAHIASHDLKSPLRNIVSYTGLLKRNLSASEKQIVKESLYYIEKNGKRMSQLIEDVLEYSKFSNQEKVNREIVNLGQLATEISQLSQITPDGKTASFEVSQLPNLKWNSSKLFLLFKNLIENGIKYNDSDNPKIRLYSSYSNDKYSICFEDNGIGIEEEYYDKIFVMFSRLHNQDQYDGTGLGLAICKKLVDEFEGEITVSSELGKGTIFKIEFPKHLIHQSEEVDELALT